jgi:two-component system, chemotaxis family, chemotaxis protein CheY
MAEAEERRTAKLLLKRLAAMGMEAHLLPGGRCVRARMRLWPAPFPLLDGPGEFRELVFATVGATQIKCLEPRALFQLPFVSIAGCTGPEGIEERVRAAWAAHRRTLVDAHRALRALGIRVAAENGATLAFPIGVEDREAAARCLDAARLALPSRGPLSGVALARASERVHARPAGAEASSDVEIALTNHLERLAPGARAPRLLVRALELPALDPRPPRAKPVGSGHRVLLVGPLLGRDPELVAGLRQLGHRTRIEYSIQDALEAFASQSFELVLADTHIGRAEGIELVPALSELPGIERLPVVLVDERSRESVREAARRVGAAGYLAHPIDPARISAGLERLLRGRGKRRFARLGQRLAAHPEGSEPGVTIAIGRLGLSVRTPRELASGGLQRWTIRLAELGEDVRIDAETIYRIPAAGPEDPTAGLRIRAFPDRNEPLWIDYLTVLDAPKDDPED